MSFVQTAFLGALAALAIPVIVHLMFRMRSRRVDLGTLRFLREVLQENARRKKIKRFLLLALRMACLALLALLFARPYLSARGMGDSDRLLVVLIDRSASMELPSGQDRLIDQAVDRAKTLLEQRDRDARIEVAFFDHTVRAVDSEAGDDLLGVLSAPRASFCATDYGAAVNWARDVCVRAGRGEKELHIFTDLQRSGLDWSDVAEMPANVQVELHDLGRASPNNVAVTSALLTRTLIRPGDAAAVHVTVSNEGPFLLKEVPLRLLLRSQRRTFTQQQKVTLSPGGLGQFEFQLEGLASGLWQGQVEIDAEDELLFDNRRFLALMAAPPWKVLIVDGQPHPSPVLSETHFLETALRLAPPGEIYTNTPYDPRVVGVDDADGLEFEEYELVVLANVANVSDAMASRLGRFVNAGGGLVVFTGDQVDANGYRSLSTAGLTPGRIAGIEESNDLPWRLQTWQEGHSIFAPFNDPQHGDLRRSAFQAYTKIDPSPGAAILATFRGGDPALLEIEKGEGRALWFASSCDRQWNDWPRSRLYLPLVHQMLGHLTGLNEGGPVRRVTIDASSELAADVQPGVYQRGRYWEVVNPSSRESETDRCTQQQFADRFALTLGEGDSSSERAVSAATPTALELHDAEIWHWMVFALVGALCVECLLANRTTA